MTRIIPYLLFFVPQHLPAQILDPFKLYNRQTQAGVSTTAVDLLDPASNPNAFMWYLFASAQVNMSNNVYAQAAACTSGHSRVTQQQGAPSGTSGSTTLTDKSDIPEVLAAAFESGGVTRTVQGNAVTFSINGEGIYKFLTGQNLCVPEQYGLQNFSAFATFEVSTPGTQSATVANPVTAVSQIVSFLPDPHTLNGAGLQWAINNPHDSSSQAFQKRFAEIFGQMVEATSPAELTAPLRRLQGDPRYQAFLARRQASLRQQQPGEAQQRQTLQEVAAAVLEIDPDLPARALAIVLQSPSARRLLFAQANEGAAYSLKYSYDKPYNQSAIHNIKAIASVTPQNRQISLTANFGMEFFDGRVQSGVRDIQVSGSALHPMAKDIANMPATLSLAGYYQYQKENALLVFPAGNAVQGITLPASAATLLAPKGNIWIVQALLTLTKSNTVSVPIGFTYSNRTELLTGSEVKGHVGIQFNGLKDLFSQGTANAPRPQ